MHNSVSLFQANGTVRLEPEGSKSRLEIFNSGAIRKLQLRGLVKNSMLNMKQSLYRD